MKSTFPAIIVSALLLTGCANEFNQVYKTSDYAYKYEYAKESFLKGKYTRATTLLQDLVTLQKGTDNAQESLYMLAMAQYMSRDYESAAATFKKYFTSYPKGVYAEKAEFYVGQSLYMSTPEPRPTIPFTPTGQRTGRTRSALTTATLLIGTMLSFYNAGSATNYSNHAYKMGPIHYGTLARGCKTAECFP